MCLVLNDPAVMGHGALGKRRLQRVVTALMERYDLWRGALTVQVEADYLRVKLDARLGAIFGDDLAPFEIRYDWVQAVDTIKKR